VRTPKSVITTPVLHSFLWSYTLSPPGREPPTETDNETIREVQERSAKATHFSPLSPQEITPPLRRDAFGFRGRDRRSEASAEAEPGRKAGTDRRVTVGTTVTEGIPECFRPAKPKRIAPRGPGAKREGIPLPFLSLRQSPRLPSGDRVRLRDIRRSGRAPPGVLRRKAGTDRRLTVDQP
jgi:hypothetical protein